jgi:thymidylate kinase
METIEFLGLSRAGKTTQQEALARLLESEGYRCARVSRPPIRFNECDGLEDFHVRLFDAFVGARRDAEARGCDFAIYERGFHDRLVLLGADAEQGLVSQPFYADLSRCIADQLPSVTYPILFKLTPETSLARWDEQRRRGLDNSHLCAGLDMRDTLPELRTLGERYAQAQRDYGLLEIDSELPQGEVVARLSGFIKRAQLVGVPK